MAETKNEAQVLNTKQSTFSKIRSIREMNLVFIIVGAILLMGFTNSYFATWNNVRVLLNSLSIDGIVVIGMTVMLIVGGIDLSVGSMLCFSMTICAMMFKIGMNPWLAAVISIAACASIGGGMGLLVTRLKLTHFIVTLAFMGILRGLVLILSTGTPISIVSALTKEPLFTALGQGKLFGDGNSFPAQLPFQVIIFVVIALIADYLVRNSSAMRKVFYTGSNPKAAEYSGIDTRKTIVVVGVVCSALAGFAGIIYLSKFAGVPMSAGSGLEMTAISAAVIGGASLVGGKGSILGSILGLTLMQFATNALTLYGVNNMWYQFVQYSILLGVVVLDQAQLARISKKTT